MYVIEDLDFVNEYGDVLRGEGLLESGESHLEVDQNANSVFIYLFKILKTIYKKKQSHTTREGAEGKRLKCK